MGELAVKVLTIQETGFRQGQKEPYIWVEPLRTAQSSRLDLNQRKPLHRMEAVESLMLVKAIMSCGSVLSASGPGREQRGEAWGVRGKRSSPHIHKEPQIWTSALPTNEVMNSDTKL